MPISKRRLGPNGKMITRRYFWRCEVNAKGKIQTRLAFKKKDDDLENKMMMRDNAGTNGKTQ